MEIHEMHKRGAGEEHERYRHREMVLEALYGHGFTRAERLLRRYQEGEQICL